MSSVITLPPKGITAVCLIMPPLKMATSVVPPPMSTKTTPASFSSSLNTASEDANGSKFRAFIFNQVITHLVMFLIAAVCPATI